MSQRYPKVGDKVTLNYQNHRVTGVVTHLDTLRNGLPYVVWLSLEDGSVSQAQLYNVETINFVSER